MAIRKHGKGLLAAAFAAMAIVSLPAHEAIGASTFDLDPQRVRWSRLLFEASHGLTGARSEFRLAPVPAAELKSSLLADAGGPLPPLPDSDAVLMVATVDMSSKLPFVGDTSWETRVWFLPASLAALQRTRTKIGDDSDRKTYRYFPDGVRRIRLETETPDGIERQSGPWTAVRTAFHSFGPARAECRDVSDPSVLLYLLSAVELTLGDPPLEMCVFNKKGLYRAEIQVAGPQHLPVRYAQRRGTAEERIETDIAVLTVVLSSRPIAPTEQEPEPFEFFEMRGDIEVSVDPASGLPVRVRGTVNNVGEATFRLVEVDLVR